MRIETLSTHTIQLQTKKSRKIIKKTEKKEDSYISAIENSRNIALESIKAKVKSGFYSKKEVMDDISDKLAYLFDRD